MQVSLCFPRLVNGQETSEVKFFAKGINLSGPILDDSHFNKLLTSIFFNSKEERDIVFNDIVRILLEKDPCFPIGTIMYRCDALEKTICFTLPCGNNENSVPASKIEISEDAE